MLIGIDVGGTFTDGVLFDGQTITATVKHPTDNQDLKSTLLQVMDKLLIGISPALVSRVVFSTTLVTNLLATESGDRTALLLMPGHGLPLETYRLFTDTHFLQGSIDFKGRKTAALDRLQVEAALAQIDDCGIKKVAIVGKFSNRNSELEREVAQIIAEGYPDWEVALGSETAGQLNFLRRIVTTYYSVMTRSTWTDFVGEIEQALAARGLQAHVDVLKADGGTMPLHLSTAKPCETIFSGPAASTMGAVALVNNPRNSVVIDIGGTTADISLLIDGQPLYASKGARIQGHFSHIKAFSVYSLPLGGDSPIVVTDGIISLGSRRRDTAACFGGDEPTVTDVFNQKYSLGIGAPEQSADKLNAILSGSGFSMDHLCTEVEKIVVGRLQVIIEEMFREWENEPAYRVWEVVHGRKFNVQEIIGIGAASAAIVPLLAQSMQVEYLIPEYAAVANALGACVARPTLALKIHVDTEKGYFVVDQDGISGSVKTGQSMQMQEARDLARQHLLELARGLGMEQYAGEAEFYLEEQFNVIRGWSTAGKIFDIGIQIAPGIIKEYQGVSR
ncbi:MAG: hydantoinase/oxoprolinase family protein [Firmicutes bacterium]|nr:hydantoinase/oxoprolinase family protein [Bacillota bacterium]